MQRIRLKLMTSLIGLSLSGCVATELKTLPAQQQANPWFSEARQALAQRTALLATDGYTARRAKNIILFVGDGMGVSTVTAARILEGQLRGQSGEENWLSFEWFPYTGFSKTYNVDAQTPDSAGTMTAMVTGVKTNMGVLGLNETAQRGHCHAADQELMSILELAELNGLRTGLVTTTRLTHATPAALYAKSSERDWEDDRLTPAGCTDIARQFVRLEQRLKQHDRDYAGRGIDIALGGGLRHFLPETEGGQRTDGNNLVQQWQSADTGRLFIQQAVNLQQLEKHDQVLGLFSNSHLPYELDRLRQPDQPSLSQMTKAAVRFLQPDTEQNGYFLMIESGRIDHAHHAGNAQIALRETIEFSNAVKVALDLVDLNETLIIVTADHSHVMTMSGYPKRGNPILGKVIKPGSNTPELADDQQPYTTLSYANGRGLHDFDIAEEINPDRRYAEPLNTGRVPLPDDTKHAGFHQQALVPLKSETHGGEDVAIYGIGPGSALVGGTQEQNIIFHIMLQALGLAVPANDAP